MDIKDIVSTMKLDKKSRGGQIEMVLPLGIGKMAQINGSYGFRIEESLISRVI